MTGSKTLDKIITELSSRTSSIGRKLTVVLDAGIATNDNLKLLEKNHIKYVCVSRSGMSKYPSIQRHYEIEVQTDEKKIVNNLIWKQKPVENKDGYYLLRNNLDQKDKEYNGQYIM